MESLGEWILIGWYKGIKICECSICHKRQCGNTPYCSQCGKKMKHYTIDKHMK